MVTIYQFEPIEGQEWIFPADSDEFERFLGLDGTLIENWPAPKMKRVYREEGNTRYSDFPWLGEHAPLLRHPAVEVLEKTLKPYGQLLPLTGERVWLLNVTLVLPALDEQRSKIVRFDDGSVLAIEHYAFRPNAIAGAEIFKIPMRASPVFVSNVFTERVRRAGLKCVSFKRVWSM